MCYLIYPQRFLLHVNGRSHILIVGRINQLQQFIHHMKHTEYLKTLEKEIHKINKVIDQKIINGEDYLRESRDHKLLIRKVRQHTRTPFFNKLFPSIFQF